MIAEEYYDYSLNILSEIKMVQERIEENTRPGTTGGAGVLNVSNTSESVKSAKFDDKLIFTLDRLIDVLESSNIGKVDKNRADLSIPKIIKAVSKLDMKRAQAAEMLFSSLVRFNREFFAEANPEQVEDGALALHHVGRAIIAISKALMVALPFFTIGLPSLLYIRLFGLVVRNTALNLGFAIVPLLAGVGALLIAVPLIVKLSNMIGDIDHEKIKGGAVAIRSVAASILVFSTAGFLASYILSGTNYLALLAGAGLIAGYGVLFSWMGRKGDQIRDGGRSLTIMGVGITSFAVSMMVSSVMGVFMNPVSLAITALAIGSMALLFNAIGKMARRITFGSLAVAAMGGSLLLFSHATKSIVDLTYAMGNDMLWKLPVFLLGIGTVYALAGLVAPQILLGAIGFAAIGGSLLLIGLAIEKFMGLQNVGPDQARSITNSIKSVIGGIAQAFNTISMKEALLIPLKLPAILGMALALNTIAAGIAAYERQTGKWGPAEADSLSYVMSSISKAFAVAGSSAGASKVFGFKVGRSDIERGVKVAIKTGKALNSLSKNIMRWKGMKISNKELDDVANNISTVLNVIPGSFAVIGAREKSSVKGIRIGKLFIKNPFSKGDVSTGIKATKNIGKIMKRMYDGVVAWRDTKFSQADIKSVTENVTSILGVIPYVFAEVGRADRDSRSIGFLGIKVPVPFKKSDVTVGVKSVKNISKVLNRLYRGIKHWRTDGKNGLSKEMVADIATNISGVLTSIPAGLYECSSNREKTRL
jgi:hypothetical protein